MGNEKGLERKVEKLLQGGGSGYRNLIITLTMIFLAVFGVITYVMLQDPSQDDFLLALGICGGGSGVALLTMIYVIVKHHKYRKHIRKKYENLTREEFEEVAKVAAGFLAYPGKEFIVFSEDKLYGNFAEVDNLFTKSFTWIRLQDIVWAYEKRESYALPHYRKNEAIQNCLIIRDCFGNGYEFGITTGLRYSSTHYQEELEKLKTRNRKCVIGYSKEKHKTYKAEPNAFYYKYD